MNALYVLYDSECEFCARCRAWLDRQRALVKLRFVALQSEEAKRRFPDLRRTLPDPLVVVSDEGAVYEGPGAFIMCLYALEDYREWAEWLARPAFLPLAARAFNLISKNRFLFSDLLRKGMAVQLEAAMAQEESKLVLQANLTSSDR